jgi:hypothetical protein
MLSPRQKATLWQSRSLRKSGNKRLENQGLLGVKDLGMLDIVVIRQLGRPQHLSQGGE